MTSTIFLIAPDIDNRTLLEYACVSLASANAVSYTHLTLPTILLV